LFSYKRSLRNYKLKHNQVDFYRGPIESSQISSGIDEKVADYQV